MRDLGRLLLYGGALQSAGSGVEELLVGERAAGKKEKQICVQPERRGWPTAFPAAFVISGKSIYKS